MKGSLMDRLENDPEEMRLFQQEWLILEVTEVVANVMEEKGIRKKDLAEELGRSKGYVTQLLDGRANMTLRTISDVMWALGCSLSVDARPLGFSSNRRGGEGYQMPVSSAAWDMRKIGLRVARTEPTSEERKELRQAV